MIGQFVYLPRPSASQVVVEMGWRGALAGARVIAPDWVVAMLEDAGVGVRPADEFLALSMALSYGVLIATLSGAKLVLSGDLTVWPREWGDPILPQNGDVMVPAH